MKLVGAVSALLVALLAPAYGSVSVLRGDRGGLIWKYEYKFAEPDMRWEIDGECTSACTIVLGTGRACATPRARLGFHAGSIMFGTVVDASATEQMRRHYPADIKRWVDRTGAMRSLRVKYLRPPELWAYLPRCR